ncbi:TIR domain-containing protein [Roseicella frigidaeris]|uniref:Thoeris protein ThsB TIR-like domain-containing protein n=1 Tax=Roseicella frigidaeris TaxID=2230885 RepID=A0A327LWI6_9PROT|nr:TIR domain-containing protein [Roseicella frigidaeris]RAI54537.1 hypothetical protein DOO78_26260 [Roseicella frigidaeris]
MARKGFYSFYYKEDNWRVATVKGIGAIESQKIVSGNEFEEVKKGGDAAIQKWIDDQLHGRSCVIVLVGANTAGRRWVNYEIKKGWDDGKGVLGVRIHNLLDRHQRQSTRGTDPFAGFTVGSKPLSTWVKTYDPPFTDSQKVYAHIAANLEDWVETAIKLRNSV